MWAYTVWDSLDTGNTISPCESSNPYGLGRGDTRSKEVLSCQVCDTIWMGKVPPLLLFEEIVSITSTHIFCRFLNVRTSCVIDLTGRRTHPPSTPLTDWTDRIFSGISSRLASLGSHDVHLSSPPYLHILCHVYVSGDHPPLDWLQNPAKVEH